jgi:hypothetical protein
MTANEKTSVSNRYRYRTAFNPGLPGPASAPSTSNCSIKEAVAAVITRIHRRSLCPDSDQIPRRREMTRWANSSAKSRDCERSEKESMAILMAE